MVAISEGLKKILTWIGVLLALVGAIIAAAGFGGYTSTINGMFALILVWLQGIIGWFIVTMFLVNPMTTNLGLVLAIIGSALLLFLVINDQFIEKA